MYRDDIAAKKEYSRWRSATGGQTRGRNRSPSRFPHSQAKGVGDEARSKLRVTGISTRIAGTH